MPDNLISVDEYLNARKDHTKGDCVIKAGRGTWDPQSRSATFIISTEEEDRDRDIIHQVGLDTDEFSKNPVAFFAHNSYSFPIGKWSDVTKILNGRPKRTEAKLNLVKEGGDGQADRGRLPHQRRHTRAGPRSDSCRKPSSSVNRTSMIAASPATKF